MISWCLSTWPGHLDVSCKDGTAWTSLNNLRQTISNVGNVSCAVISRILDPQRPQSPRSCFWRERWQTDLCRSTRLTPKNCSWKCSCGQGNAFNGLIWELLVVTKMGRMIQCTFQDPTKCWGVGRVQAQSSLMPSHPTRGSSLSSRRHPAGAPELHSG